MQVYTKSHDNTELLTEACLLFQHYGHYLDIRLNLSCVNTNVRQTKHV